MQPRLQTSKKWTAFPKEFATQVFDIFETHFKSKLKGGKLIVEGRIYPEEVLLRVGVLQKGKLAQQNFEVSAQYSYKDLDADQKINDCIDVAATLMDELLSLPEDQEIEFPLVWTEFSENKSKIFFKYTTVNTELEAEADKLLGVAATDDLVKEEPDDDPNQPPKNKNKLH